MSATTRVGTAVAAGYVLGRFKKMRLALIIGSALANRNVRAAGMDFIRGPSESGSRATSPIIDAGRSAMIAAASTSMNRLSDRIHERSAALGGVQESVADEDEDYEDEPPEDEDRDEDADLEEDEDLDEEEDLEEDEDLDDDEDHRSSRRRRTAAPGRS